MPKGKEPEKEKSGAEAIAPLSESTNKKARCCGECEEGLCCDERVKPNIISFEELLKEAPKNPCIE